MIDEMLLSRLQAIAHHLQVTGRPEMAATAREAMEKLRGLEEQLRIAQLELRTKARAIDKAMDILENAWSDPGLYGEGDT